MPATKCVPSTAGIHVDADDPSTFGCKVCGEELTRVWDPFMEQDFIEMHTVVSN